MKKQVSVTTRQEQLPAQAARVANIGLGMGGALVTLIFLRFLYLDLSGQRQFTTTVDIVLDYGLPGSLSVLLFASLGLKSIHKLHLLTSCVAFMASLYAVELFAVASAKDPQTEFFMALLTSSRDKTKYAAELARKRGTNVDLRTPEEVFADFRKKAVDAIPMISPSNHLFITQPDGTITSAITIDGREVIPLAGVSNRVTLLCNEVLSGLSSAPIAGDSITRMRSGSPPG